jgi:hypothetical protein
MSLDAGGALLLNLLADLLLSLISLKKENEFRLLEQKSSLEKK